MRAIVVSLACVVLAGCNLVSTSRPLIGPSADAPRLRDGLWAAREKSCAFDTAKPERAWPPCAGAFEVEGGQLRDLRGGKALDTATYRFSPGEPWLIQIAPRKAKPRGYFYAALEPATRDSQGRITGLSGWIVACGPVAKEKVVTAHPFPGLVMDGGKDPAGCTTDDLGKLRNAARLSRSVSDVNTVQWVRAGEH